MYPEESPPCAGHVGVSGFVKYEWLPCRFRGPRSRWLAAASVSILGLLAGRWGFGAGTETH